MNNGNPYFDPNTQNSQQYTPFAPNGAANSPQFKPKNPYIDQNGSYGDFDRPLTAYVQSPTPSQKDGELRKKAVRALGFGIAALVTSHIWLCSFLGIIFGAVAKSQTKRLLAVQSFPARPCAVVGRILGNIGFILGIVVTALVAFIISVGFSATP